MYPRLASVLILLLASPLGAAVTYISGDTDYVSSGGTVDVPKPASLADDDVLVAFCFLDSPAGGTTWSNTDSFIELDDAIYGCDRDKSCMGGYKVITNAAGEPATYDFTSTDTGEEVICLVLNFRGVDTTTPIDATLQTACVSSSNSPDSPSITTTTDDAMLVLTVGSTQGSTSVPYVVPTDFTEAIQDTTSDSNSGISSAYDIQASAGASGTKQWSRATAQADHCLYTWALRESGAGGVERRVIFVE